MPSPTPVTPLELAILDSDQPLTASIPQSESLGTSLLTLSIAAANAAPIALPEPSESATTNADASPTGEARGLNGHGAGQGAVVNSSTSPKQHRRLSSAGKSRRRLSDARDAAARPLPAALQTTSAAISLASLSLSSPSPTLSPNSASFSRKMPVPTDATHPPCPDHGTSKSAPIDNGSALTRALGAVNQNGGVVNGTKNAKKKGMDHKCECCSKIYRHPSCLIKHRWEHTPHWREASKFVLSKHQQVQLLEAAAILSHLSPSSSTGTSLPEDRSLWPSFLSGGALPPPSSSSDADSANSHSTFTPHAHPTSSSVPAYTALSSASARGSSVGPRLHDYSIPASANGVGGITQLRPGLIGVPTGHGVPPISPVNETGEGGVPVAHQGTLPVPVPRSAYRYTNGFGTEHRHNRSNSWGSESAETGVSLYGRSSYRNGKTSSVNGGWSLPGSSLRSVSGSSVRSRSRSDLGSRSDGEEEGEMSEGEVVEVPDGDVDVDLDLDADIDIDVEVKYAGDNDLDVVQLYGLSSTTISSMDSGTSAVTSGTSTGHAYSGAYTRKHGYPPPPSRAFLHGTRGKGRGHGGLSVREEDENEGSEGEDGDEEGGLHGHGEDWDGMDMDMDMD